MFNKYTNPAHILNKDFFFSEYTNFERVNVMKITT